MKNQPSEETIRLLLELFKRTSLPKIIEKEKQRNLAKNGNDDKSK